jgi:hypothetical protein
MPTIFQVLVFCLWTHHSRVWEKSEHLESLFFFKLFAAIIEECYGFTYLSLTALLFVGQVPALHPDAPSLALGDMLKWGGSARHHYQPSHCSAHLVHKKPSSCQAKGWPVGFRNMILASQSRPKLWSQPVPLFKEQYSGSLPVEDRRSVTSTFYAKNNKQIYLSSGQSSWLQIQRSEFDSRHYQILWVVVNVECVPLSLVSTIEGLLEKKKWRLRSRTPRIRPYGSVTLTTWLPLSTLTSPTRDVARSV